MTASPSGNNSPRPGHIIYLTPAVVPGLAMTPANMSTVNLSVWKDPNVVELYKVGESVTGPAARHLIQQSGLPTASQEPLVVIDMACGTGIVTSLLYEMLDAGAKERMQVTCGDFSESMVRAVQQRIDNYGWNNAKAQVVDAQDTGLPSDTFTHILAGSVMMMIPDTTKAFNESLRILKPGGVFAFSVWEKLGWVPDFRAAMATIPGAPPFPDSETILSKTSTGPWNHREFVEQQLAKHGFVDIKVEVVPTSSIVEDSAVFAKAFAGVMVGLLTPRIWSTQDRDRFGVLVEPALTKHLTEKYDGEPFKLEMIAIIATGRKP